MACVDIVACNLPQYVDKLPVLRHRRRSGGNSAGKYGRKAVIITHMQAAVLDRL